MISMVGKKENIFGDEIAFLEHWNFSRANLNDVNRILAITQVASICYQSPKSLGSESLYNRLMAESQGLPSSSFEFVPILLTEEQFRELEREAKEFRNGELQLNLEKFGEWIVEDKKYLLTNFRALVYDVENCYINKSWLKFYNTEEECSIIEKHFKVFLYKVDFPTRSQMVRHRVNWQELSRRYVSGTRIKFDYYISGKMKNVVSKFTVQRPFEHYGSYDEELTTFGPDNLITTPGIIMENIEISYTTQNILDICTNHYIKALEDGAKPQEARRIIPQAGYTQLWGAYQPKQLENYFKLRDDTHAQWEIRQTAIAMKELLGYPIG